MEMSDHGMELHLDVGDPEVISGAVNGVVDDHTVPEEERLDEDALDPNSVANPEGDDLSWVKPDEGDLIDLEAMG